jgi:hypothetical protein
MTEKNIKIGHVTPLLKIHHRIKKTIIMDRKGRIKFSKNPMLEKNRFNIDEVRNV